MKNTTEALGFPNLHVLCVTSIIFTIILLSAWLFPWFVFLKIDLLGFLLKFVLKAN